MKTKNYIYLLLIILFFSSCAPSKFIKEDGYLLSNTKIECDSKLIEKSDLKNLIKQDPNGRFLGIKWGMYFYSLSEVGDIDSINFLSRRVFRTLGSKPVEINHKLTRNSVEDMKIYLNSKGVFNARVKDSLTLVRRWYAPWTTYKKRRNVVYKVEIPSRYKINNFSLFAKNNSLKEEIISLKYLNKVKKGDYYDEDILKEIRTEVATDLRSKGYFAFNESYIEFAIDTNLNSNALNIEMIINPPYKMENDTIVESTHKPYKINKVFVYPDYYPSTSSLYTPPIDTSIVFHQQQKRSHGSILYFIRSQHQSIKDKPIARSILLQKGNLFSPTLAKNTFAALSQLQNFKYIDISFLPTETKTQEDTLSLDCLIRLSMAKPINLTSSFEFNFSNANNSLNIQNTSTLGSELNFGFSHNNLFKGAEIFSTNIKLAAEVRSDIFSNKGDNRWSFFNAFEFGFDFGIELPRFLAPFSTNFYSMNFRPHTSLRMAFNTQKRTYFDRNISTLNYEYSWRTNNHNMFSFIPLEVNYVDLEITDDSYNNLIQSLDKRIQYQMTDHMVMDTRFSFSYNGQDLDKRSDFNYIRTNIEAAGNFLYLLSNVFKQSKNDNGQYEVFNIPYSQYVRADFDFIRYFYLNEKSSLVARFFSGCGYYYGNANSLPYEKSFFAGGANNNRAWQLRELGPGSSSPQSALRFDRAGDIAIGGNIEYRFPISGIFEGATFIDIGNIWTINEQKGFENGQFELKDFYKEFAIGGGLGLRLNIQFLIIRLDLAMKLHDPSKAENARWVIKDTQFKDLQLQFGIGYPF
ncbi:MAG: BamA/TamA family outer membrane protein [Bacteroidales bacterium]|nr:BamA/TamA family outer membrane protein [Bacteroidales bacterium]